MKIWMKGVAALVAAAMAPDAAWSQTPFEATVLTVLNEVRANPAAFAATLQTFRTYFRGASYAVPGEQVRTITSEGVAAVDDAIAYLSGQRGMGAVLPASTLNAAAGDHVAEQEASGEVGHRGSDGSSPGDRAHRRGGGRYVAEVIEYGAGDPVDVVRQLVVDDGVVSRGHRAILLDPSLRFAGISCGMHPTYRTMCVIVMEGRRDGHGAGLEFADARR